MQSLGGKFGLGFIAASILVLFIMFRGSMYTVTSSGVVENTYVAAGSLGKLCNYAKVTVEDGVRVIPISAELYGVLEQGDVVEIVDTYQKEHRWKEKVSVVENVK